MRRLRGSLSRTFLMLMIFAGTMGVALWVLTQLISVTGRIPGAAPVGTVAARYRRFATTGT